MKFRRSFRLLPEAPGIGIEADLDGRRGVDIAPLSTSSSKIRGFFEDRRPDDEQHSSAVSQTNWSFEQRQFASRFEVRRMQVDARNKSVQRDHREGVVSQTGADRASQSSSAFNLADPIRQAVFAGASALLGRCAQIFLFAFYDEEQLGKVIEIWSVKT